MTETFHLQEFALVAETFEKYKAQLQSILPSGVDIQHIGATAVPGSLTKGDVDICVRMEQADFLVCDTALANYFMRNIGSTQTEYFSSFHANDVGIQLVITDSPLDVFIKFRDLLIQNPDLLKDYNQLKQRYDGKGMADYRKAKDQFIKTALDANP